MSEDSIKVTAYCLAYNHEKYIRKTWEGSVNQKTNFGFQVIVHDDASTDNTANIIREYEKKYPDIIKPIYQKQNQHSKGVSIFKTFIYPQIKGKYIAICEGDDYWCDNSKIQKQFDYMEKHPECSLCVHNTIKHDLKTGKEELFNDWKEIHELTANDIFYGWKVHTSSFFTRKEFMNPADTKKKYWFGDFVRLTKSYYYGKVVALPDVMSVYNWNNPKGMTVNVWKNRTSKSIEKIKLKKEYLLEYNRMTNNKYKEIVDKKIIEEDFNILIIKLDFAYNTKEQFNSLKEQIRNHQLYKEYFSERTIIEKIKLSIKINSYISYKIYKTIRNILKKE